MAFNTPKANRVHVAVVIFLHDIDGSQGEEMQFWETRGRRQRRTSEWRQEEDKLNSSPVLHCGFPYLCHLMFLKDHAYVCEHSHKCWFNTLNIFIFMQRCTLWLFVTTRLTQTTLTSLTSSALYLAAVQLQKLCCVNLTGLKYDFYHGSSIRFDLKGLMGA